MLKALLSTLALIFLATLALAEWPAETALAPERLEESMVKTTEDNKEEAVAVAAESEEAVTKDTATSPPPADYTYTTGPYPVVRVIDGDTIVVNRDGKNETVRLIGIDTPETVHPEEPVQCFGQEASAKTKEWLEGAYVRLEFDAQEGEYDKYGRLLAYVHRADGLHINLELIRQGYAYEYTYYLPYHYQSEFKVAEREAETAEAGLWSAGVCNTT